jgi:hypothetical protein
VYGDEKMKIRFEDDKPKDYACVHQPTVFNWGNNPRRHPRISHYKRLRANVEAETIHFGVTGYERPTPDMDDCKFIDPLVYNTIGQPERPYADHTREGLLAKIAGLESDLEAATTASEQKNPEKGIAHISEISMVYKNYRGETSQRTIRPVSLTFKRTEHHPEYQWILRAWDVNKEAARDFALRDCNFKNCAEASEAPTPIITGPGEYKTAMGEKAFVDHLGFNTPWPATGFIGTTPLRWNQWGASVDHNLDHHITGSWVEDEPEPKPEKAEVWVNLYRNIDGELYLGERRESTSKGVSEYAATWRGEKYIGTVLLSHTVEEGE